MKKIFLGLATLMIAFIIMPIVKAQEKVPVYMFTKNGCSACLSATQYFEDLSQSYPDLFELIDIEVFDENWQPVSDDLRNLLVAVYEEFGEDSSSASTPTIVIGDYHTLGLPQDTSIVYDEIVKVSNSEENVDKVKEIADSIGVNLEDIKKASTSENSEEENKGKYDAIIVIGIFAV